MLKNVSIPVVAILSTALIVFLMFFHSRQPQPDTIIIADAHQPAFSLIYIATHQGFFKEEGLDVQFRHFSLGKDALTDVLAGNADLATVYEAPAVKKILEGEQIRILTTLHRSTQKNTALIALKSRGINTAADLKHKKIAVPFGTSTELFLYSILNEGGIKPEEVQLINLTGDEGLRSLLAGSVDAAALYSQYLIRAQNIFDMEDYAAMYSDSYFEFSVLAGKKDYVLNNKSNLTKLLKALVKAEKYFHDYPEQAVAAVLQELPGLNENEIQEVWGNITLSLRLDNMLLTIMNRHTRLYNETNSQNTSAAPILSDYLFTDYLKTAKPEGVTIY